MQNLPFVLTFIILFTLLFFIVGAIIGWMFKQYQFEKLYMNSNMHPEMFDANGNILPDEILAIRFENDYDEYEDEEE
jgi:hypothetical protein